MYKISHKGDPMKIRKIITTFIVFAGISLFFVAWQVCLPDGCFYAPQTQTCQDGNCIGESVSDHINERGSYIFARATDDYHLMVLFAVSLFFLSLFYNAFFIAQLKLSAKLRLIIKENFLVYNKLVLLFSKGILNPKIY